MLYFEQPEQYHQCAVYVTPKVFYQWRVETSSVKCSLLTLKERYCCDLCFICWIQCTKELDMVITQSKS